MKTVNILFFMLFSCFLSGNAQLKMTENGKISVGRLHSLDNGYLKLGNDSSTQGLSFYDQNVGGTDFRIFRQNNIAYLSRGGNLSSALKINSDGRIAMGSNINHQIPMYMFGATLSIYSQGNNYYPLSIDCMYENAWAEIIRCNGTNDDALLFSGWVWDYFNFYVKGDGTVWTNGTYTTSDASLKSNIKPISGSLEKVMQLRGVTFDNKRNLEKMNNPAKDIQGEYEAAKKNMPKLTLEIFKQMEVEKTRQRMGVIAQEVETVIPEVVRTRPDGLKAVSYPEMIGLLIEAVKELKAEVDELKGNTISEGSLRSALDETGSTTGIVNPAAGQCKLYQNAPNPFTNQTEIKYFVEQGVKDAYICIFDMQGKMLQKLNVTAGQNSIIINGSELQAGMYLYSLVVDGKEVDTKRMILTK